MLQRLGNSNVKWALAWSALAVVSALIWNPLRAPQADPLHGPPWLYGKPDARFTLALFGDLECPQCQAYLPQLLEWVDRSPNVNLRWHHLASPDHMRAAVQHARLVECIGQRQGRDGFWKAVAWTHLHGHSPGLPGGLTYARLSSRLRACVDSDEVDEVIHRHRGEATGDRSDATPRLRLVDNGRKRAIEFHGPIEPDELLWALGQLVASDSADAAGFCDMP